MRTLAVLSMHTSPLAQPGMGDGGGMNVYVRELSSALARAGARCDVYTRASSPDEPAVVAVEPGLHVHHVAAGPVAPVPKEHLPLLVDEFTENVLGRMHLGHEVDLLHANYWLSGMAGHTIKHRLDLPLVSTFHTLARVKADATGDEEPELRAAAEAHVIGCSDAVLANCRAEVDQLVGLYGADPARIEIVHPGVDHAFFSPGPRAGARRAIGVVTDGPVLLFVGRIQPLKGADVAVRSLAALDRPDATLVVVGGPSGPMGAAEVDRVHALVQELGVERQVRFVAPQPHELLSSYYRAADVVLVPSRSESFGLVALEAAACGRPVVASAVGGLETLVEHGRTGFLVETRDPAAFAAHVAAIVDDPLLATRLGDAAAARARTYSWRASAERLRTVYEALTERVLVECR